MKIVKQLLDIVSARDKVRFRWLLLAIILLGFLEVMGIAAVLPFMELLSQPNAIEQSTLLKRAYDFFGFSSHRSFLIGAGLLNISLIAIANLFAILTIYLQFKISWDVSHKLSCRLLSTYLNKPYDYFLKLNTASLRSYIISEVNTLTSGIIVPLIELISRSFMCLIILTLLVVFDPLIAFAMFVLLGGAYVAIYLSRKALLKKLGTARMQANVDRYRYLEEVLTGIKTVKVFGANAFFYNRFSQASRRFSDILPKVKMVYISPKYILEILAFGGILAVALYIYISTGDISKTLPRLTLYAAAGYRLLPALQHVFASASKINHNRPVLDKLHEDLTLLKPTHALPELTEGTFDFEDRITLDGIQFQYEGDQPLVLKDINLDIKKGTVVAFVGATGSGKTTITDLIAGLLFPSQGSVKIDNKILRLENAHHWHRELAYVPQDVFLYDDTLLANITLGSEHLEADQESLHRALKMAKIDQFIEHDLADGLETKIGERGVRLSGGQRQRIGLARALYRNPKVLILDEATSALDSITEQGIIEALKDLPEDLTIVIIAHRLSTVKYAQQIYLLDHGSIVKEGDYESLQRESEIFRKMVHLS